MKKQEKLVEDYSDSESQSDFEFEDSDNLVQAVEFNQTSSDIEEEPPAKKPKTVETFNFKLIDDIVD